MDIRYLISSLAFGWLLTISSIGSTTFSFRQDLSLSDKVSRSDVVVVGSVRSVSEGDGVWGVRIIELSVDNYLKGSDLPVIHVYTGNGVAGKNIVCCALGGKYLMFLERTDNGIYLGVDGANSSIYLF